MRMRENLGFGAVGEMILPLLSMVIITSVGHLNEDDRLGNMNVKDLKSTLEGSSPWGVVTLSNPRLEGPSSPR